MTFTNHKNGNSRTQILTGLTILLMVALQACQAAPSATPIATGSTKRTPSAAIPKKSPGAPLATPTPTQDAKLAVDPAALAGVTIRFWHPFGTENAADLEKLINQFNTSNEWKIKVEITPQGSSDDLYASVAEAIGKDDYPEVVLAYPFQANHWDTIRPVVQPIGSYVADAASGIPEKSRSDFLPSFWNDGGEKSPPRGLPVLGSAQMLYYNQNLAEELGFSTPPATPDEFEKQACAAAKARAQDKTTGNDKKGGWIISTDYATTLGWIEAYTHQGISNSKGYQFNTPEVKAAFSFMRRNFDEGCAWLPDHIQSEGDFTDRLGLFSSGSLTALPYQKTLFTSAANQDAWTVLPFPGAAGKPLVDSFGLQMYILDSTAEKQMASWLFARWLSEPANQALLARATGFAPVRQSAIDQLKGDPQLTSQQKAALDLLANGQPEPGLGSWLTARWAVGDAAKQLYQWYFKADQIPATVALLDTTVNDFNRKNK